MTACLLRLFAPDKEDMARYRVRCGQLAGAVGIATNALLCIAKLLIGLATHSISVMADAVNNLSDALSSVISLVGFHMSGKAPDEEHPFGHGRMEYIAALFVSTLILFVGFQFIKSSAERIIQPAPIAFSWTALLVLALSLPVKLWLGLFNRRIGTEIQSPVLMAAMQDSLNDVITTSVVLLGMIASRFTTLPVDGYVGIAVALFILHAGYGLAKDALDPLLGQKADPALAEHIREFVESYDDVLGTHDLIVHNYGAGQVFATVHAEVAADSNLVTVHETIDAIEHQVFKTLHIFLVIHMDPIELHDEQVQLAREQTAQVLADIDPSLTMHDFRMVNGEKQINLIFDVVVSRSYSTEALRADICRRLKQIDSRYHPIIVFDHTM